jgi:hypothetical protein
VKEVAPWPGCFRNPEDGSPGVRCVLEPLKEGAPGAGYVQKASKEATKLLGQGVRKSPVRRELLR